MGYLERVGLQDTQCQAALLVKRTMHSTVSTRQRVAAARRFRPMHGSMTEMMPILATVHSGWICPTIGDLHQHSLVVSASCCFFFTSHLFFTVTNCDQKNFFPSTLLLLVIINSCCCSPLSLSATTLALGSLFTPFVLHVLWQGKLFSMFCGKASCLEQGSVPHTKTKGGGTALGGQRVKLPH